MKLQVLKKYRKINSNNGIGCVATITPPMEKMGIFSGESIFFLFSNNHRLIICNAQVI